MKSFRRAFVASLVMALLAAGTTAQPAAATTEVEPELAEMQDSLKAKSEQQAELLPEDDEIDEIVNKAVRTNPSELVAPEALSKVDVAVGADELVLDTLRRDGPRLTMHRMTQGANLSELDESGIRAKYDESVVLEATESSIRIMEVIADRRSAHRFRYHFEVDGERANLILGDDGGVAIAKVRTENGEERTTYFGVVDPAWVVDVNGNQVDVAFELTGNGKGLKLTVPKQSEGAYPLVADPKVGLGPGVWDCGWTSCTLYHKAADTRSFDQIFDTNTGVTLTSVFVTAMCGILAWLATVNAIAAFALAAGCSAIVASQQRHYGYHFGKARDLYPDGCVTTKLGGSSVLRVGHVSRSNSNCFYSGWASV